MPWNGQNSAQKEVKKIQLYFEFFFVFCIIFSINEKTAQQV